MQKVWYTDFMVVVGHGKAGFPMLLKNGSYFVGRNGKTHSRIYESGGDSLIPTVKDPPPYKFEEKNGRS